MTCGEGNGCSSTHAVANEKPGSRRTLLTRLRALGDYCGQPVDDYVLAVQDVAAELRSLQLELRNSHECANRRADEIAELRAQLSAKEAKLRTRKVKAVLPENESKALQRGHVMRLQRQVMNLQSQLLQATAPRREKAPHVAEPSKISTSEQRQARTVPVEITLLQHELPRRLVREVERLHSQLDRSFLQSDSFITRTHAHKTLFGTVQVGKIAEGS